MQGKNIAPEGVPHLRAMGKLKYKKPVIKPAFVLSGLSYCINQHSFPNGVLRIYCTAPELRW